MMNAQLLDFIPHMFGKYWLKRRIESGSTCVVAEAVDKTSGIIYAVKIMPFSQAIPNRLKQAIDREIRVLQRVNCSHICKLYDVVKQDGLIFLVLEYCEGGNLLTMILDGRLQKISEVQRVFKQILQGVKYLHDHNIAHGDIKPENVVFDVHGNAKLIDLGYCKEKLIGSELDKSGTLYYAAPEILSQGKYNTHSADVWALGILLFVMATSRFPYASDQDRIVRQLIRTGKLLIYPTMNDNVADLFKKMTTVDPADRCTIEQLLASPWLANKIQPILSQSSVLRLLF
jgi:serine/threonine protein kinase